jgi:minimal PKS chain-length factor (CLF/KS beta)
MTLALKRAGVGPDEIDAVFADAAGTLDGDLAEARAIKQVFGDRAVPVTAPKTMTGRLYAGGSSLDVAAALLSMRADAGRSGVAGGRMRRARPTLPTRER